MEFKKWNDYFIKNQNHFSEIDFNDVDQLTEIEKAVIYSSIQQFQRGESSEGKHLFSFAKKFPDPDYTSCIKLFIKEEQMHARVLGEFMDKHGIVHIRHHWVDSVFRWLRKLGGIANSVTVLVTAEIIAKPYYKALGKSSNSSLLKSICSQILKDEDQHIVFQCSALNYLFKKKNSIERSFSRAKHLILMMGTILVVWWHHKKVLRKGGYYFSKFWLETLLIYYQAEEIIKGKSHHELDQIIVTA